MVRTQVYLTETEKDELRAFAEASGRKQSTLIREALDQFLDQSRNCYKASVVREAAGMWKDRTDLPNFEEARSTLDRS
jgi:predicted DNA-binding protein